MLSAGHGRCLSSNPRDSLVHVHVTAALFTFCREILITLATCMESECISRSGSHYLTRPYRLCCWQLGSHLTIFLVSCDESCLISTIILYPYNQFVERKNLCDQLGFGEYDASGDPQSSCHAISRAVTQSLILAHPHKT